MSCGVNNLPDEQAAVPVVFNLNAPFETSVFYNDFSSILGEYRTNVVFDANRNLDRALLNLNTREMNKVIVEEFSKSEDNFKVDYPYLYDRVITNPLITPSEIQRFIESNFFQPTTFVSYVNQDSTSRDNTLYLFNQFYSPASFSKTSMGSFCSLVPNIFAKFAQFQDIFAGVAAFAAAFQNIMNSLTNFSFSSLIDGLKSKILGVVDNLVKTIKNKIATFSAGFVALQNGANAIYTKISKLKEKVQSFLSDLSVDYIKKKIEGMISFAASLFENLDIEEIEFMILRFCSFINELEGFFTGLTKPLEQLVANYQSAGMIFKGGDYATAAAIAAGATRLSADQIQSYINFLFEQDPTVPVLPGVSEYGYQPSTGSPVSGGVPDIRGRSAKIQPITRQEIDELPTWEDIRDQTSKGRYFRYVSGLDGSIGWTRAQTLERVMLLRLAKRWGTITINSAFRTPEYNASVGGAKSSFHMSGQAFDCGGIVRNQDFVNLAKEIGFTGFGFYNSFTHIDTGPPRSW